MRLLLINSGNDKQIAANANSQSWPPLNIISLGTAAIRRSHTQVELELMDGQIDSIEAILLRIRQSRSDVVGVSMYSTSIRNTVSIVNEARAAGALVVVGNDHAAFHHKVLLENIPAIDFICIGDVGEDTLPVLLDYHAGLVPLSRVPNIAYLREGQVVVQREPEAVVTIAPRYDRASELDRLDVPDRTLLDKRYWSTYLAAFRNQSHKIIPMESVEGVATINRARGCGRAKNSCRYCGIADLNPRGSAPEMFWQDVRQARDDVGANFLYEAFDSATSWPSLVESWAAARPPDLASTRFKMYAQAAETSERTVEMFRQLGVFCVNTGFDSGDDYTLKLLKGKHDSLATNMEAARRWTGAGIEIYTSFVLVGLGNEAATRRSLDATLKFAEWLATETSTVSFDAALLYPDRSSRVGRWIWEPERFAKESSELGWSFINYEALLSMHKKWAPAVYIDPLELCADFSEACGVSPELLFEYEKRLHEISTSRHLNFGRSQGGPLDS